MALGSTQPVTEMNTRNLPGGKGQTVCGADILTTICEPTVYKMWECRRITTLWAFMASYSDSFTFFLPLGILMGNKNGKSTEQLGLKTTSVCP
jgi:hypothetical protein